MRLRVKQDLPFSDTLPGAEHDSENPWYASTEKHTADTASGSRAEASFRETSGRAQGDVLIRQPSGGSFRATADGRVGGAADAAAREQQGKPLNVGNALGRESVMTDGGWQQQRLLERMSSDANSFRGPDVLVKQDTTGRLSTQDPVNFDLGGGGSSTDAAENVAGNHVQDPAVGAAQSCACFVHITTLYAQV